MSKFTNIIRKVTLGVALGTCLVAPAQETSKEITGWGDFKLFLDPGHAGRENQGLWGYSEAEKVLRVAWSVRDNLLKYTDMPESCIKLCRETDADYIDLTERVDVANAWDADFYYSIHSDAGGGSNTTVFLFGGWSNNGVKIEKTPTGGKTFGEILDPNLTGVMRADGSRGTWYDRCFYEQGVSTHENQWPYLAVNRRSNMASLLSEGGYHTLAQQQRLNMNDSYKTLEGYAAFRSILQFRGLKNPVQPILTGVITNSENNVPINGVTVTVGDQTVITDTYESLFNKYTSNPNLIHNGFFKFDGLEGGKEYDVKFSSPDFGEVTKKVTIKSELEGKAADNITWCDVQMTSSAPAKVASTSIEDPTEVSLLDDIVLTFSRNMDKTSVEKAISITPNAELGLKWDDNATLRINISKLSEEFEYKLVIDGSIAKNSQTNQFLDGDGDGKEGGNYELVFTTLPPDVTAPTITSTTPSENSTMSYNLRPVIRVEYSEQLNWNEDAQTDVISVEDKSGKKYDGVLKHTVVNNASVVQYYLKEDLVKDQCYLVKVSGGIPDIAGNLSSAYEFKFLSEYRPVVSSVLIDECSNTGNWYQPHGSGSSKGWTTTDENTLTAVTSPTSGVNIASSFEMKYAFDPSFADAYWQLREYRRLTVSEMQSDIDGILQMNLYGDGSNNTIGFGVRANKSGGGVKIQELKPINFRGWETFSWQMNDGKYTNLSGDDQLVGNWWLDCVFMKHENVEEGDMIHNDVTNQDEQKPYQDWTGAILFDNIKYVKYDNTAVQTAKLSDISGVEDGVNNNNSISIFSQSGNVYVKAAENVLNVEVYNANGEMISKVAPVSTQATISGLSGAGIYIIKVVTTTNQKVQKLIL